MQKFLIIQTAFIGDVVLATSLIEKLHDYFPDSQIDFLVREGNQTLLTGHPIIRNVLIWNKRNRKLVNLIKLLSKIRFQKYDMVINIQRYLSTGLLTAFSGAARTVGFDKNPLSIMFTKAVRHALPGAIPQEHEIMRNQKLIADITDDKPALPKLYPLPADQEKVGIFIKKPFISIAPASVWFTKQYPAEKWASFINNTPHDLEVLLLGSASDYDLGETIRKTSRNPNIKNLCGKLSYLESCALMKKALMNYVNDSAPLHFASAMNAPVAAVFCSTIPSFGYGPLSEFKSIIEIREPLYCRPCGIHGLSACPEKHFRCAWDITDDQLLTALP